MGVSVFRRFILLSLALSFVLVSTPTFALTSTGAYYDATWGSGAAGCVGDTLAAAVACNVKVIQSLGGNATILSAEVGPEGLYWDLCWAGSDCVPNGSNSLRTPIVQGSNLSSSSYDLSALTSSFDNLSVGISYPEQYGLTWSSVDLVAAYSAYVPSGGGTCEFGGVYPACDPAPTCQYGGVYPACDPAPTCQYGGVYPACDPAPTCEFGGTYPACNADPDAGGGGSDGGLWDSLTAGVDFSTVIIALLAVFASLALVGVAFFGGRSVLASLGFSSERAGLASVVYDEQSGGYIERETGRKYHVHDGELVPDDGGRNNY